MHLLATLLLTAAATAAARPQLEDQLRLLGLGRDFMSSFEAKKAIFCGTFCRRNTNFWCSKCPSVTASTTTPTAPTTTSAAPLGSSVLPASTPTTTTQTTSSTRTTPSTQTTTTGTTPTGTSEGK